MNIRIKLLLYMTVNILIFSVTLLFLNVFFTEKLYISYKKNILLENSEKILGIIDNYPDADFDSLEFELNRIEKNMGGSINIGTIQGKIFYPLKGIPGAPPDTNPFSLHKSNAPELELPPNNKTDYEYYNENSYFIIREDPALKIDTLRFQINLENGLSILLWLPMSEISESSAVFNKMLFFTAILILFGSILWSLFMSSRFTKPITQMNKIAKKMSMLDFTETLYIQGTDEIAQLAASINKLSHKLNDSINELNEKNLRLEMDINNEKQVDKMRKEFISGVSHELKTPLFLIQGYAEGLKHVALNEEKRNYYCDVIMTETEKMDKLLKDLLDLAQMEAGMFTVKKSYFDIVKLSKKTFDKFQNLFEEEEINAAIFAPSFLTVYADPVRTEQILVNFINNALNHIDSRREIRLEIVVNEANKAKMSLYNSGSHIPDNVIGKIWDTFYTIDESRTRINSDRGGTGLGLSIVRAIQNGHENNYGVENKELGVEFFITLDC